LQNVNEELQAFTYSVSHDLRAPLRAIDGFSAILVEDHADKLDEGARELLGRIRRGVRRMSQLIQSLLDLSRATRAELRKQTVKISDMAASVIEGLRHANPERKVEVSIEPGLTAEGDPNLIRIVLENLLSNAWKFSSRREMARIDFGAVFHDGGREFFVRDNGAGFDAAQAARLFKPFQRLHSESEFEGSGIGLATAQRIVRRHGGAIRAESNKNGGATFYFSI
jgi:signal transduction histidine kinase